MYQIISDTHIRRLSDGATFQHSPGNRDYGRYLKWVAEGNTPLPAVVSLEHIQTDVVSKTQQRLDTFAGTRNYDSILSACTYITSSIPQFMAEAQYCVNARDATWASLYDLLTEVQTGTRPIPTGFADIEAYLPVLAWPA
jgi:hypothetical protein